MNGETARGAAERRADDVELVAVRKRLRTGYPGQPATKLNAAKNDVSFLLAVIGKMERETDAILACLGRLVTKMDEQPPATPGDARATWIAAAGCVCPCPPCFCDPEKRSGTAVGAGAAGSVAAWLAESCRHGVLVGRFCADCRSPARAPSLEVAPPPGAMAMAKCGQVFTSTTSLAFAAAARDQHEEEHGCFCPPATPPQGETPPENESKPQHNKGTTPEWRR